MEKRLVVSWGLGCSRREVSVVINGNRRNVCGDGNKLYLESIDVSMWLRYCTIIFQDVTSDGNYVRAFGI